MFKIIFAAIISISLLSTTSVDSAPYFFGNFEYHQPNGVTFKIRKIVDEFGVYNLTEYGALVKNKNDGYYYYAQVVSGGKIITSNFKAGIDEISEGENIKLLMKKNSIKWTEYTHKISGRKIRITPNGSAKTAAYPLSFPSIPDSLYVLLVEFNNVEGDADYTKSDFENMFFGDNYTSSPDGETTYGSFKKYYYDMSGETKEIEGCVSNNDNNGIPNWIELPNNKVNYHYEMNFNTFAKTVRDSAKSQQNFEIDLSDGSRKLAIIYAGNMYYTLEDSSGSWCLHSKARPDSGYYIMSEKFESPFNQDDGDEKFTHIGDHTHEFGHLIGDFGDYYAQFEPNYHFNNWGVMAAGSSNGDNTRGSCPAPLCPHHRQILGWLSYTDVDTPMTNESITYNSNYSNTDVYKIQGTCPSTEYFLIENRQTGTGTGWNSFLNSNDGILIWHIDTSEAKDKIDLVEADGTNGSSGNDMNGDTFRSGNNDKLTDFTSPSAKRFTNYLSNVVITGIGSSQTTMSANLSPRT